MENITIEHRNGDFLVVNPRGGMVHGWANGKTGKRMLYPFFIREEDSKERGGSPIPFPAFGSPAPVYSGENQHGWLRDTILALAKNEFSIQALGSRRVGGLYNRQVTFHIIHTLYQDMLASRLQFVLNDERAFDKGETVLFRPAFHDYFPNNGKAEVTINGKKFTSFTGDAQCISLNGGGEIVIDTGEIRMKMVLEGFDLDIACVYIWSDASNKYFCVEPVYCSEESFLTGKHLKAKIGIVYDLGRRLKVLS